MTKTMLVPAAIAAAAVLIAGAAHAQQKAYTPSVQQSCQADYLKFCSEHAPGSEGMRRCMEANGKQLSNTCINALVDAGEIAKTLRR